MTEMVKLKKNQRKGSWVKALSLAGLIYAGSVGATFVKNEYPILIDPFFNVPGESALEEKIGKNVCFEFMSSLEAKETSNRFFEKYRKASGNWDCFDKQFELVSEVVLKRYGDKPSSTQVGTMGNTGTLSDYNLNSATLVHELAHRWYDHMEFSNTKKWHKFNREWVRISENHYPSARGTYTKEDFKKSGAVSEYALTSLSEDVAETSKFVYTLNHPDHTINGFPNNISPFREETKSGLSSYCRSPITTDSIEKIRRKIELMRDYEFFSEREYGHALKELDNFNRN